MKKQWIIEALNYSYCYFDICTFYGTEKGAQKRADYIKKNNLDIYATHIRERENEITRGSIMDINDCSKYYNLSPRLRVSFEVHDNNGKVILTTNDEKEAYDKAMALNYTYAPIKRK